MQSDLKSKAGAATDSAADRPSQRIHYQPLWNDRLKAARHANQDVTAILVCHGMGQQVRYQTISSVAEALLIEARRRGATTSPVDVVLSQANDDFLARAEVKWKADGEQHEVHVYEAYWAPLTEGKVTYWETIKFLFRAGYRGFKASLRNSTFDRWMFGEPKPMPINPGSSFALLVTLLSLLLVVAIIALVSLTLAAQWKLAISSTPTNAGDVWDWLRWAAMFVPGVGRDPHLTLSLIMRVIVWIFLTIFTFAIRYFVIEYVGDVAAYISPYKDSKFDELRHQIRKIGLNVGKVVYGFEPKQATVPNYSHVVMVGHSLGSILAYDTLNSLINVDQLCPSADRRDVVNRTRALVTFGSPLDKTAFMFRLQAKGEEQWIREALAASMQPLIVDYKKYRPSTFHWINLWSRMDVISGALNYYDDPNGAPTPQQSVHNMIDPGAWVPFAAHVQYWHSKYFRRVLYDAVGPVPQLPPTPRSD